MLKIGNYNVCILDLITDDKTRQLSASKLWLHICNAVLTLAIIQTEITWELMTAYGAIVGGNHVATMFLKWKYRDGGNANVQPNQS